jgi:hypothetical protein
MEPIVFPDRARAVAFELFLLLTFTQTHSLTTSVLVNEFDAGGFNRSADFLACVFPTTKFPFSGFEPRNRGF